MRSKVDKFVENLLKLRFINKSDENYPPDALHMYSENQLTIVQNQKILVELTGVVYSIEAHRSNSYNCKIYCINDSCCTK